MSDLEQTLGSIMPGSPYYEETEFDLEKWAINYLQTFKGVSEIEVEKDEIHFDYYGYHRSVEIDTIPTDGDYFDIEDNTDLYSCCDRKLDKDIMLCPICKEHC